MTGKEKRAKIERELLAANRRVVELKAQLASTMGRAFDDLPKASEGMMGSAILLTITTLGGRTLVGPVAISDGLTPRSVAALQEDVCRSFANATMVNPAMAWPPVRKESA